MMNTLKQHSPTALDHSEAVFIPERSEWFVSPVIQTRDSRTLETCNFRVALDMLGGECDNVEVHRFGHWGPGWYEIIIVRPNTPQAETLAEIYAALEGYPVLNDDVFSEDCATAIWEYWDTLPLRDKIYECARAGESIFSARDEQPPSGVWEHLESELCF